MNVKVIRMNSGEEVIFTLIEETDDTIEMENALVAMPTAHGELGFGPWAPLIKNGDTITIKKQFVVYIGEPQDEVSEQYQKIFSPIETPSKKLIL